MLVALVVAAFAVLLREAWSGRVGVTPAVIGALASIAIALAAPLLLSRDVFTYAEAGRIAAQHHGDPYVVALSRFRRDPFVSVTSAQWLRHHTVYGPAFTLMSELVVRAWRTSPGAAILAFKALAAIGILGATMCTLVAARAVRPDRTAFAVAVVGLNPVVIVHTVGGGHVDAIIAGLLAAALAVALRGGRSTARSVAVTALLTLACLVKMVILPALALWVWWTLRAAPAPRRVRLAAVHVTVVAGLAASTLVPFAHGWDTFTPLASAGGLESWASPAHLVAHGVQAAVQAIGGAAAGRAADRTVVVAFLVVYAALLWRVMRTHHPADGWGAALLLLALAMPFLLPWYACWFVPFLGLMRDEPLGRIGVAVSLVLALTLVPADPFRGFTTLGVMAFVHYVAAPVLLVLFALAARHVWSGRYPEGDGTIDPAL